MAKKNGRLTREAREEKMAMAKVFYCELRVTQKEAADRVGVTEATFAKWREDGNWDAYRASITVSKDMQIKRLMAQIEALTSAIETRDAGKQYATVQESDILAKLTKSLSNLEHDLGISEAVTVMKGFLRFVRIEDASRAQELSGLADAYINHLLN